MNTDILSYRKLLLLFGFTVISLAIYSRFPPKQWTILYKKISVVKPQPPPICGFYHFAAMGENWRNIVHEQLLLAHNSGLFSSSSNIYVTGLGKIDDNITGYNIFSNPKFIYEYNTRLDAYEMITLRKAEKFCLHNNESFVWYAHSKGVTHTYGRLLPWRDVMNHFVLDKWRLCYDLLSSTNYTTCGAILTLDTQRKAGWNTYYAGNMWWAKCSHINRLTRFEKLDPRDRYIAELYVTSEPAVGHFNCHYVDLRMPIVLNKQTTNCSINYPLWVVR